MCVNRIATAGGDIQRIFISGSPAYFVMKKRKEKEIPVSNVLLKYRQPGTYQLLLH